MIFCRKWSIARYNNTIWTLLSVSVFQTFYVWCWAPSSWRIYLHVREGNIFVNGYSVLSLVPPSRTKKIQICRKGFICHYLLRGLVKRAWCGCEDERQAEKNWPSFSTLTLFTPLLRLTAWFVWFCEIFQIPSVHSAALWMDTSVFIQINAAS